MKSQDKESKMKPMVLHKSLPVKTLLVALALITVTEPAWAILGVWRRAAVRTAVVVGTVGATEAAAASANAYASQNAAAAAAAQQSAAASAAAAQQAAASASVAANPPKSPQQKLRELQSLYDQQLITASEYQASKQKILNEMTQ
jgi:hypothetical protein